MRSPRALLTLSHFRRRPRGHDHGPEDPRSETTHAGTSEATPYGQYVARSRSQSDSLARRTSASVIMTPISAAADDRMKAASDQPRRRPAGEDPRSPRKAISQAGRRPTSPRTQ